jgi:hypothetical protein
VSEKRPQALDFPPRPDEPLHWLNIKSRVIQRLPNA